ncbi:Dos2p [Rhodotorula paludigena]|uniref:Dos2p n=1 Tax=Rhodotorula paludigena TaxID=86838 RepID=UPI00317C87EB
MESLGGFVSTPIATPPRSQTPVQGATPAPAPADSQPQPLALDKEVQNVVSGFSSFWGRVKKQGTAALQTAEKQLDSARADLTPLISQARAGLDQLGEQTRAEIQRLSETPAAQNQGVVIGADGMPVILDDVPPARVDKGKGVDREGGDSHEHQETPAAAASAFFASLAKNQNVKDLSRNLTSLQSNLSTNLHQLQSQLSHLDLSEGQKVAENYLHKGEHWFQEFSAEVGKLAKDAVKVVPPGASAGAGTSAARASLDKAAGGLSRREQLVYKLRSEPSIFLVDPADPPSTPGAPDSREAFAQYLASVQQTHGSFESESFQALVQHELVEGGEVLRKTRDELVPAQLSDEAFWTRYFWRKQQIEDEEERRKKVLQVAEQDDDDFSWDMDDEDGASSAASPRIPPAATSPTAVPAASLDAAVASTTTPAEPSAPDTPKAPEAPTFPPASPAADPTPAAAPAAETPASPAVAIEHQSPSASDDQQRSPRASSDGTGSYDLVSAQSGNPSGDEGAASPEVPQRAAVKQDAKKAPEPKKEEEDDDDSDWE